MNLKLVQDCKNLQIKCIGKLYLVVNYFINFLIEYCSEKS